jgi:hypothetical protein
MKSLVSTIAIWDQGNKKVKGYPTIGRIVTLSKKVSFYRLATFKYY